MECYVVIERNDVNPNIMISCSVIESFKIWKDDSIVVQTKML